MSGVKRKDSQVYSQNDEEKFILEYFDGSDPGRFLDIGAADGICMSNTYALYLKGWTGMAVEPSRSLFIALAQNVPRLMRVNTAIGLGNGLETFYDSGGDLISTLDTAHRDLWAAQGVKYEPTIVTVETWDVLLIGDYDFDFLNLDVEGTNIELMKQIPLPLVQRLKLACIEFDGDVAAVRQFFEPHGFKLLHQTGENMIMARPKGQ